MRRKVVIGFLGTILDRAKPHEKWDKWRPTVSLFQHDDLLIDRFEMIYQPNYKKLANEITEDIASISPEMF